MLAALLDLLLPPRCAGCGAPGAPACPGCTALLRAPALRPPEPAPPGLPECWSAARYAGPARRMILAYKERGRTALAPVLAGCLAEVVAAALGGRPAPVALVPVPSARAAVRRRGHDPMGVLATRAAALLRERGVPAVVVRALRPARRVADQAGLTAAERAANLAGALEARAPRGRWPAGLSAVPVDDIVTTGATLAEASRALRAAGARVAFAATLAATSRRRPARHARPAAVAREGDA
ncbi:ComF family protein [Thermobispora bispora]|uniref:ComF family protein n=1 Tax=Thermobispora bispora TaxID=2006 RepID=UPI00197DBF27|nr:phosphoribosyltransferase family protein [Thermobispora bispora]QSI47433.1 ComF family protein [Thermobispora bispora]